MSETTVVSVPLSSRRASRDVIQVSGHEYEVGDMISVSGSSEGADGLYLITEIGEDSIRLDRHVEEFSSDLKISAVEDLYKNLNTGPYFDEMWNHARLLDV